MVGVQREVVRKRRGATDCGASAASGHPDMEPWAGRSPPRHGIPMAHREQSSVWRGVGKPEDFVLLSREVKSKRRRPQPLPRERYRRGTLGLRGTGQAGPVCPGSLDRSCVCVPGFCSFCEHFLVTL